MEVAKATDVVAAYKAIIDKTKNFATNLKALKAAGLNGQLFAQIVSAGVDAGGETAAAIVAGGADTIASLNDLFGQLDDTATTIAATSTDIMYQTGLDITNSFIDGLMAQDTALQNAASTLATNFNNAFKNALDVAVPSSGGAGGGGGAVANVFENANIPSTTTSGAALGDAIVAGVLNPIQTVVEKVTTASQNVADLLPSYMGYEKSALAGMTVAAPSVQSFAPGTLPAYMSAEIAAMSPTYNLTVNAGMGSNGKDIGLTIVQALSQYERTNGAVYVRA
jgi:hypothetical protein